MRESVPVPVWLVIVLAVFAAGPLRYVIQHIRHDPRRRDITRPPEDLSWRSPALFYRSLVLLVVLAALAVFVFTPAAARFASSRYFWPTMMLLFGGFACGTAVLGLINGRIEPLVRGGSGTFERATQPKRFWASLLWNALLGAAFILGTITSVTSRLQTDRCFNKGTNAETARATIAACNELLAKTDSEGRRAPILAYRGIGYDWLGDDRRALADYSGALDLSPQDPETRYNRARIYDRLGDREHALLDYDVALELRPDNAQALINRGLIFLDTRQFDKAISDFTRAHEVDPANPWALANRGVAHAWKLDRAQALSDFDKARAIDPANYVVLHGEAILDLEDGKTQSAVRRLSEALRRHPNDAWALRVRADAYRQLGQRDKASADEDRLARLLERRVRTAG